MAPSEVDYSILGPLSVRRNPDGARIVLSEKLTLLLGRLLVETGTVVPASTLANDIWDEDVELRNPVNSVQRLVSELRQRVGDTGDPRRMIVSVGAAYRIEADPLTVDAERFRLLARRGHALVQRHPRAARAMLDEALACWQGPVLGGYRHVRWVAAFAAELDALRSVAEVDLNETLLALGEYDRLEGPLRRQLALHPTDERRHAQLIRALEGMAREAEAGLAYRDAVLELGSPGTELRRLGERVARGVRVEPAAALSASADGPRPNCLLLHGALERESGEPGEPALGTATLIVEQGGGEPHPVDDRRLVAVFEDAQACARAARALACEPRLRCAVGLDRGGTVQMRDRLLGPGPARSRLLADAAQPGQVLVSAAARERDWGGVALRDVIERDGDWAVRGEPVFELADGEGAMTGPPPPVRRPHNLPAQQSRFVGRARELAEISPLLTGGELITLVGAGGCGKTRLALELGARSLDRFDEGAWFAGLAELPPHADAEALAVAVVARLEARALAEEPARETLVRHLSDRSALLIVDNCEHVLGACRELVVALRRSCPQLCLIATSRRPLRIDGERVVEVPAMGVDHQPDGDALPDALELLLERAGPQFDLAAASSDVLADARRICVALDGSPLGIELAAAHVPTRGLSAVAAAVEAMVSGERELDLFVNDDPARAPRQRTIEATISWSHDLLDAREQAVLRRLAVFCGSFGMEEAEVVAGADELRAPEVADVIGSLIDCSMVASEAPLAGQPRLRLKQAIRAFLLGRLERSGELDRTRSDHAAVYGSLAARVAPTFFGRGEQLALERLEADHDNMRGALSWLVGERRAREALELVGALWWLWFSHNHFEEGSGWVRTVLALDDTPSRARVRALRVGSHLEWWRGDYAQTDAYNRAIEECAREIGDAWGAAWALMGHGAVLMFADPEGALMVCERSRRAFAATGREWEAGYALQLVALGHCYAGRNEAALAAYEEVAPIFERLEHGSVLASVRRGLGLMAARCGQPERGRALCREALAFSDAIGDRAGMAQALNFLASISFDDGELETAAQRNADALSRAREIGDLWATCSAIDGIASVACERGEHELAARLLARTDRLAERAGYRRPPHERARREAQDRTLRSALGGRGVERATAEGELMSVLEAVASAHAFVRRLG